MGELCLVPDSFLCLLDLFREVGKDSDLDNGGGVGVLRAEFGALAI